MKRYAVQIAIVVVLLSMAVWEHAARSRSERGQSVAVAQQGAVQAQQAGQPGLPPAPYVEKLPAQAKLRLEQDGFVVTPGGYGRVSSLYWQLKEDNIPIFVTTDAMLHTSHQLFDWCLRFLEIGHLRSDALDLTDAMLREMMAYHGEAKADLPKEAALLAAAYFSVGKRLLDGGNAADIPEPYRTKIENELQLVQKAGGLGVSPLMGYREDYSQYKPRGHYSRSEAFERYFRCLMWYGRMTFRVSPAAVQQPGVQLDEMGVRRQALAAAMVARALRTAKVKGETAEAVWKRIYETTSYFAGPSDDLTLGECGEAFAAVYGAQPKPADFADERKLSDFMARLQGLRKPRILSTLAVSGTRPGWQEQTKAVSFMGQRFSVDGLILQKLVFDSVGQWQGKAKPPFTATQAQGMWIRGLPRGLDVMAGLGSEAALKALQQDGDTEYEGYDKRLGEVRQAVGGLSATEWTRDLYMHWFGALNAVTKSAPGSAPQFTKGEAWPLKQVHAALGSWTELKHDTTLYTKQPYGMAQAAMAGVGKGGPPPPAPTLQHGYVEPVPDCFGRLAGAVEDLRRKLTTLGFPRDAALEGNLDSYAGLLRKLEVIARKELAGQALSQEEYQVIWNIGDSLRLNLSFPHYTDVTENFMTPEDLQMPLVADVATDVNSGMVLEQALGEPMHIHVIAPVDGKPTVCKGVAYSYHEFKQPMANRLTDEQWRTMLHGGKPPAPPAWTARFICSERER